MHYSGRVTLMYTGCIDAPPEFLKPLERYMVYAW